MYVKLCQVHTPLLITLRNAVINDPSEYHNDVLLFMLLGYYSTSLLHFTEAPMLEGFSLYKKTV